MAICTQQTKVPFAVLPVGESPSPTVDALRILWLFGRVDMVNVKHANIVDAALNAFSSKRFDNGKLAPPYRVMLMRSITVRIPEVFAAFIAAISKTALLSALPAFARPGPSRRQIAIAATKASRSISDSICVRPKDCSAMFARFFNLCVRSHKSSVSKYTDIATPKYFEDKPTYRQAELV